MMKLWPFLFSERCPKCNKTLDTTKSNAFYGTIVISRPSHHYQKEFQRILETFIEHGQVS